MSLDIALSGIKSIDEQLTTVSNNIANAGTYGFKSSRANFSSMYAGNQATGTEVTSLTQSIGKNGTLVNTGRGLDAGIDGSGFFASRDTHNVLTYSRVGIFSTGSDGYLINANGDKVQGYSPIAGSSVLGPIADIKVPTQQIPAVATAKVDYVANLSSDWVTPTATFDSTDPTSYNMSKLAVVYDSLGSKHDITQYFVKTATNEMTTHYSVDGAAPVAGTEATLTFNSDGSLATTAGAIAVPAGTAALSAAVSLGSTTGSVAPFTVTFNYTGTTQFAGEATTSTMLADGYASGTFTGVELGTDGTLLASYTNGHKQNFGSLALANFANQDALTSISDTSWAVSNTSGAAQFDRPGAGMTGVLKVSALEQSNVDLTSELVSLMSSQRNYQANSKVISTETAMLQSLMQAL